MHFDWTWLPVIAAVIALAFIVDAYGATPVTVSDGDTIIWKGERIRLWGIDAPETDQPGGTEAKTFLAAEIMKAGKTLRIEKRGEPDRYGRTLAIVYAGRKSINAAMVESGNAWAYLRYADTYEPHQLRAYKAGLGIWKRGACPPIHPEMWRRGYR